MACVPAMADRIYTRQEADAILARALERQGDTTSHEDLVAAAGEIGVSREALERAAGEILARRSDDAEIRLLRARRWRGFVSHLVPYVLVGALLGFINFLTTSFPWVVIVMLAWGVGLASHLASVVLVDDEQLRARLQRRRLRVAADGRGRRARVDVAPPAAEAGEPQQEEELEDQLPAGSARSRRQP